MLRFLHRFSPVSSELLRQEVDEVRVSLASRLEIAVVIRSGDDFLLLNPEVSPELQAVFSPVAKAVNA